LRIVDINSFVPDVLIFNIKVMDFPLNNWATHTEPGILHGIL